jgi:phosphoglycolate phosphatase-like HAD superfamily hydrolase
MEILSCLPEDRSKLKVALFDFDGTVSTLRHGWEKIMEPMMLEMIAGSSAIDEALIAEVRDYIDQSTGIQTIYQMQWLAEAVRKYGKNPGASDDPWWYKAEYNRRLMCLVEERKESILKGNKTRKDFLVKGSEEFLTALVENGVEIYVASGTDHEDVVKEAEILGLKKYFKEIAGAPPGKADCSKEAVLRKLVQENNLKGQEVIVIGDGKVEIALGKEVGAITLGVASEEEKLCGVNPIKRERLIKAGAHAITGDFECRDEIFEWLGLGRCWQE